MTFKQRSKDLYPCGYFQEEVSIGKKKDKVYSSLCLACLRSMRRSRGRRSVSKLEVSGLCSEKTGESDHAEDQSKICLLSSCHVSLLMFKVFSEVIYFISNAMASWWYLT